MRTDLFDFDLPPESIALRPVEPRESARLGRDLPENDEREDYLRATLTFGAEGPVATPISTQDSSLMASLSRSNCLVIRPPHAPAAAAGSLCVILKLAL